MKHRVTVVLPTLEEQAIFGVVADIRRLLGRDTEIIAIARGSNEYFRKLRKLGVKVVYQKVKSVEWAIMTGFAMARGDILATTDADGTHGSDGLLKGVKMVENGEADMVLGNRMAGLQKGSMGPYLAFGNSALSWIFSVLYKTRIHDVLTGLFVTRKDVYRSMHRESPYRAGIAFFVIELAKRGYSIREVGIKYYPREFGTSKLSRFKLAYGLGVGVHLVRQIRDYSPMIIFGLLGMGLVFVGFLVGLWVIINFLHTGVLNYVGRALISFMLITLGIFSIIAGFILDLLLEIARKLERD